MDVPRPVNGPQRKSEELAFPVIEFREASRVGASGNHRQYLFYGAYPSKL
jgi:hypothetical protein